jgi:sporulation protein YlmC with PRC-barrel domain
MAIDLLSRLGNWKVSGRSRDVRGLKVVDDTGVVLGTVRDLIVNTESGRVERLVLDTRAEYPLQDVVLTTENLQLRRDEFMTSAGAGAALDPSTAFDVLCERV